MNTTISQLFAGLTFDLHTTWGMAVDAAGRSVTGTSPYAVRWCAMTWLSYKVPSCYRHAALVKLREIAPRMLPALRQLRPESTQCEGYELVAMLNGVLGYRFVEWLQTQHDAIEA